MVREFKRSLSGTAGGKGPEIRPKTTIRRALLAAAEATPALKVGAKSLALDVVDLAATTMANAWIVDLTEILIMTNGSRVWSAADLPKLKKIAGRMILGC